MASIGMIYDEDLTGLIRSNIESGITVFLGVLHVYGYLGRVYESLLTASAQFFQVCISEKSLIFYIVFSRWRQRFTPPEGLIRF